MRKKLFSILKKMGVLNIALKCQQKFHNNKRCNAFKKHGFETLIQADIAAKEAGSFIFLTYGTLLGAYREKGFIPYDNDLDVGMKERPDNLVEVMERHGFKHKEQAYIKETNEIIIDKFLYKGVQIDFFYHWDDKAEKMYNYLYRQHEYKQRDDANETDGFPLIKFSFTKTEFAPYPFLGKEFYTPRCIDTWLQEMFGATYMTPIKEFVPDDNIPGKQKMDIRAYRRFF